MVTTTDRERYNGQDVVCFPQVILIENNVGNSANGSFLLHYFGRF